MAEYLDEDALIHDCIADAEEEEEEPPYGEWDEPDFDEGPDAGGGDDAANADAGLGNGAAVKNDAGHGGAPGNTHHVNTHHVNTHHDGTVPHLISTSPAKSITSHRSTAEELYGFERYAGLSSWRTVPSQGHPGGGGATTMEATGWKQQQHQQEAKDGEGDSIMSDEDDLDHGKARQRSATEASRGPSHGQDPLVGFRDRDAAVVLGRSWGRNVHGGGDDGRCQYAHANVPTVGEDSVPVTLADGTRTFVKRAGRGGVGAADGSNDSNDNGNHDGGASKEEEGCLLGLPMAEVVRRADMLERRAVQRKVEREGRRGRPLAAGGEAAEDAPEEEGENGEESTPKLSKRDRAALQRQQRLWVDKHAPSSISHLLSDERTNREVLRALRAWDPYVFKKEAPARPVPAYPSRPWQKKGGTDGWNQGGGKKHKPQEKDGHEGGEQARADVRPDEKSRVLLLSGPPGVGKSTLAHIVCKHAGYRPLEVNASDERTAGALTDRVVRAMESATLHLETNAAGERTVGGNARGGKPNCIILDEIDGADAAAAMAALVDIVRADIPPPGTSGKGKKKAPYLRRPIILVCNHKYAPALRPILPYARQFDVAAPAPERLAGRLRAVLAAEKMTVVAGGTLLHRLVAATGGDVRSCLYALQFASARAREVAWKKHREGGVVPAGGKDADLVVDLSSTLMAALGDGGGNGMKDARGDASSTVAAVFRKGKKARGGPPTKRQKTAAAGKGSATVPPKRGVDLVLKAVDHFGDNSKTLDCLFMNVHRVSYVDPTLDRASSALEWLSGADTYRSHRSTAATTNGAEFQSMQKFHIPAAAGAVHLLCRVETRPDLTFSTRPLAEVQYGHAANVSLVQRFVEGLAPRARRGVGGGTDTVVRDVIPYGLWLLSAGEGKHALSRPVSSVDILSEEEKIAFGAHVDTLRALGLTYVKDEGGAVDYRPPHAPPADNVRLEPEITKLVQFEHADEGSSGGGRRDIPPLLKELLAHGATVAALREREREAQIARQEAGEKTAKNKPAPEKKAAAANAPPGKATGVTPKKPPAKAGNTSAAKNFLGCRAAKAKASKTARRAARVGFDRTKKVKLSNTGSGAELSKVVRFKYQKGFTQAVRAPCQLEDLL